MKLSKITNKEREQLIFRFCQAICQIKNADEAVFFITDLLSRSEAEMLAKRIKIAELLLEGKTYDEVRKKLKASRGAIARVSEWLRGYGDGYRTVLDRIKKLPEIEVQKPSYSNFKRRYPMYYWPEILLQEIVYSASKRRKEKLQKILNRMGEKHQLYKKLSKLLKV